MPEFPTSQQRYQLLQQTDEMTQQSSQPTSSQNAIGEADEEAGTEDVPPGNPKSSVWRTIFNMLNCMEGVGFLALPYAVYRGGITAVIAFAVFPFIMGYTCHLLVECLYDVDEDGDKIRVRSSYQEIGKDCWSPFEIIIRGLISITVFLIASSYIVACSDLMSNTFAHLPLTRSHWACVFVLLTLPTLFIKEYRELAWLSLVGVIALTVSIILALYYEFQQVHKWDVTSLLFWDTNGAIIAINIIQFSYALQTLVVPLAVDMADKSKFDIALSSSYFAAFIFKIVFAVSGFLTYTGTTKEVILNNLPATIPTTVITCIYSFNVLLTFPLILTIITGNIEELSVYEKATKKLPPKLSFILLRVGLTFLIFGFSFVSPHFGLLSALTGSWTYFVTLVFPGIFHLYLKYKSLKKWQIMLDCFFILSGMTGVVVGLIESLISIAKTWV